MPSIIYQYTDVFPVSVAFPEGVAYGLARVNRQHDINEVMLFAQCMPQELYEAQQKQFASDKPFHVIIMVMERTVSSKLRDDGFMKIERPLNETFAESLITLIRNLPKHDSKIKMTKPAFTEFISAYDPYRFGLFSYMTDDEIGVRYQIGGHPVEFISDTMPFKTAAFANKLLIMRDDTFEDFRTDDDKQMANQLYLLD